MSVPPFPYVRQPIFYIENGRFGGGLYTPGSPLCLANYLTRYDNEDDYFRRITRRN